MRIAILSAILFLSGISALIFQTLWLRLSGLAFGNSTGYPGFIYDATGRFVYVRLTKKF